MVKPNTLIVLLVLMLAAACGGAAKPRKFVFTPVPYTVYPAVGEATAYPVSVSASGDEYLADEVTVLVAKDRRASFERWTQSLGFSPAASAVDNPLGTPIAIYVKVPVGSAADAVELIRKQKGVQAASLGYFARGN